MAQYFPVYGYKKYYKDGEIDGALTGTILLTNSTPNLIVIDVDNDCKPVNRQTNYQNLLAYFVPKDTENIYIEKTGNCGLHIILVNDLDLTDVSKNRWCGIYKDYFYSLDIFLTVNTESRSCLLVTKPHADGLTALNGAKLLSRDKATRIKTKDGKMQSMKIISKCDNFINSTMTFSQYAKWLLEDSEIDITTFQQIIKSKKESVDNIQNCQHTTNILEETVNDCIKEINISESNIQILCNCIVDTTIHNYSGTGIKTEFSLLPYFRSVLVLAQPQAEYIVKYIFEHGNFTQNARQNYYSTYERVKKTQRPFKDLSILITMIKYNNPNKYNEYKLQLQNLVNKYQSVTPSYIAERKNCIDFRTSVSYTDVFNQNNIQQYIAVEDWFMQVQQVLMYNTADNRYYRKYKTNFGRQYMILQQVILQDIKDALANIKINNIKLYDYLIDHRQYIQYDDIQNLSDNPQVFSYFCGFCYSAVQNDEIVQPYLNHIKEIIANNNNEVYEYILNWLAYLIQNPVSKLGTTLVIIGGCGTGKNMFTTPIINLLGYYADEIGDINYIVGNFNPILEGKHLLICDEVTQQHDTVVNKNNFDRLKLLITGDRMQINQKNEKLRSTNNIINFIMLTNHDKPVVLEQDDRRYCICRTAPKRDYEYYKQLADLYKKDEFYQALLYLLQSRDISSFKPQEIPMTNDKRRIIEYSVSPLCMFVVKSQLRKAKKTTLLANYKRFIQYYYDDNIKIDRHLFYTNIMIYYDDDRKTNDRHMLLKQQYYQELDNEYGTYLIQMAIDEEYKNSAYNKQIIQYKETHIISLNGEEVLCLEEINKKQ